MADEREEFDKNEAERASKQSGDKINKKEQIIALYLSGMTEIEDLAIITGSRPSYVGSVLQEEGLVKAYFDLYTSSSHPMNVYSKFFAGKLKFKDEEAARQGVNQIDKVYKQFALAQDRAGQHHALVMALTMFDRARWTGKGREAEIYREWLAEKLEEARFDENAIDERLEEEAETSENENAPKAA